MRKKCVVSNSAGILAEHIQIAVTFFSRFMGLMGRRRLEEGEGLFLCGCSSIHCCFMRFPIDAVYLSDSLVILGIETVRPWHIGRIIPHTRHVLELREGAAKQLAVGQTLTMKEW